MANKRISQVDLDIRAVSKQAAAHHAEAVRMNAKAQAAKSRAVVAAAEYKEAKALADAAQLLADGCLVKVEELKAQASQPAPREPQQYAIGPNDIVYDLTKPASAARYAVLVAEWDSMTAEEKEAARTITRTV